MSQAKEGWYAHADAPAYPFYPKSSRLGLGVAVCPEGETWIYIRAPRYEFRFGPRFLTNDYEFWRHKRGAKDLWAAIEAKVEMYTQWLSEETGQDKYSRWSRNHWEAALDEAKHPTERLYPKGTLYRAEEFLPRHIRESVGKPTAPAMQRHHELQERLAVGKSENIVKLSSWKGGKK